LHEPRTPRPGWRVRAPAPTCSLPLLT